MLGPFPSRRPPYLARRGLGVPVLVGLICAAAADPSAAGNDDILAAVPGLAERTGRIEVDAMEYPWSAIGRVNTGGRGHCTGFLVGERSVLTAAHCLYDNRNGRWRGTQELHFVAGYQRDANIIHSPIASYTHSTRYAPRAVPTAKTALDDWAVLTLARPIGRQAGWLGLREADPDLLAQAGRGAARIMQAGYRQGWTHIMSVSLDCEFKGFFGAGRGIAHGCDLAKGDSGSPLLVLSGGTLNVIGLHVLDMRTKRGRLAGALSVAPFRPGGGHAEEAAALPGGAADWGVGRAPERDSPAARAPVKTIERLLGALGLLDPQRRNREADRRIAIAAFEANAGLPVTGVPSLTLLGQLIAARE